MELLVVPMIQRAGLDPTTQILVLILSDLLIRIVPQSRKD